MATPSIMNNATNTSSMVVPNITAVPKFSLTPAMIAGLKLQAYVLTQYEILQVVYSISYAIMFVLSVALVVYLRRNRSTAYKGDADAARKVILPAFESLLLVVCVTTGLFTFYFIGAAIFKYTKPIQWTWFSETLLQSRQFITFLIITFLLHRSVSLRSLVRSIVISFVVAAAGVVMGYVMDVNNVSVFAQLVARSIYRALIVVGLVYLCIYPIPRASVRTQRELYLFTLVYYGLVFLYSAFFYVSDYANGFMVVFCAVIWASFAPFFVWRLLKADTDHWRGLGERAVDVQQLFRENQGIEEIVSSQGLHVLLEMHARDLIDFAQLELHRKIGVGASADVYRGTLQSTKEVAVKVYSPSEISETTILAFSQEAVLCRALKHPNIVYFHGLCICPPMICLVSELCRGSLDDALSQQGPPRTEPMWPRLCYMVDAARAVAYLHSFSPPFVHRDIKPANFLLGASNVVKLTDFGESRSMARTAVRDDKDDGMMTMRGTIDYMAPEVIDGKGGKAVYTEKADIYSLGITLWEVLHPGREKYPSSKGNHLNVYRMVLDGQRPPIELEIHPTLHDLLENAWQSDPSFRPSAKVIVSILEGLQEELCGEVAHRLAEAATYMALQTPKQVASGHDSNPSNDMFTGQHLVDCLLEHEYAIDVDEAVRLGNSLMDAGCLHHAKHALPFEANASALYYFDEHTMEMTHPLDDVAIAGDNDSTYGATSILGDSVCACRKLGQGLVKSKAAKRKLFQRRRKNDPQVLAVSLLKDVDPDVDYMDFPLTGKASTLGV
ncbi:Aste57867_23087 [Aphanomyces stellatus]|uniref:Aste57867_23087 protein n=1 Tax=Aphanomyces stellatus TaxID=120398 RepID=A0A485LNF8_9STRA|nr:hypothetical protein As57867_023016 [Aphanomyces stellatus]VFT99735.1 Aste57867_23087 [Aphanomyces stellatus]